MDRREAYAEGFQDGRRWAERDIVNHVHDEPEWEYGGVTRDAYRVGTVRGYRDTWARWDAGVLTWEMLEHAPLGR